MGQEATDAKDKKTCLPCKADRRARGRTTPRATHDTVNSQRSEQKTHTNLADVAQERREHERRQSEPVSVARYGCAWAYSP